MLLLLLFLCPNIPVEIFKVNIPVEKKKQWNVIDESSRLKSA